MRKPNLSNIVSWSALARAALFMLVMLAAFIACTGPSKASADPASDAATALDHHVAILATEFVLEHKFRLFEQAAKEQGIELRWTQVDRDDENGIAATLAGADLIIIDAPRSDDQSMVRRIAGEQLTGQDAPVVHLNHFTRERPLWAERLEMTTAQRIAEYYLAGTTTNRQRLFAYLHALLSGGNPEAVPPVRPLPDGGIYHGDYPDQVFADLQAYLHWWETRHDSEWRGRPVIAVETTSSYLSDGQTRWMDDVIARIEASDALPLVYYRTPGNIRRAVDSNSPPGDTRGQIPTTADLFPNPKPSAWPSAWQAGDDPMITLDGHLLPDVVLVNNFLGSNPDGRKAWYQAMGRPVINIINYRGGPLEEYLADTAGVSSFSIPFTLTNGEYMGLIDPVVLTTNEDGEMLPVPGHSRMLVEKALRLARLQQKPPADKRLALFFWNHPPGEHNMGASNLNVPRSLDALTHRLAAEGYCVDPVEEQQLIDAIGTMLRPGWRGDGFEQLLASELWDFLPLAHYQRWFATLPESIQAEINDFFGPPETSYWVIERNGQEGFIIPRMQRDQLVILPQPMRGEPGREDEKELHHDTKVPVNHAYLATYLWAREQLGVDAIIHFGTHGSQEWTPGQERGLWVHDYPNLLVGNVPVIYPYIVDNIGEAIHVKRRGRGVIVSHQTPPFSPAGLSDDFVAINDLIREYHLLDEGLVKASNREMIIEQAIQMNIHQDMGWQVADLHAHFEEVLRDIEDYLEDLGMSMQPLGLHTLGQSPEPDHLASTIMQMLGEPLYRAMGHDDPGELFRIDYQDMQDTRPYHFVRDQVLAGATPDDAELVPLYEQGRYWLEKLNAEHEVESVLKALDGLWLDPSYGGDPVRNPDALPTGRNMYGFDPSRIPTQSAWEGGQAALETLILEHQAMHDSFPTKLAFSMWSTETMRHLGMLEAEVFYALGVRPVWDRGGRVIDLELIPLEELGRPRIDVVLSLTGLYRDQFPNVMERFNQAIELVAAADEPAAMNPLRAHSRTLAQSLQEQGFSAEQARELALTRLFGTESGDYGTGLPDATLASDQWEAEDGQLAAIYLDRMSWGYGPDPANWSSRAENSDGQRVNIYAEQLRGVDAAVFSRSSNLRGLLDTDHPFEYLGGISKAIQHLEGRSPQLYISNMRDPLRARLQTAERFMATELRSVYQHPNWIAEMQNEGYAGTLELLDTINNFWGWQVMDRNVVRDDQWEEFHQSYVMDRYNLGLKEWFEQANPTALAQIAERMLEAVRKGYWEASEDSKRELVEVYLDLAERHDIHTPNATFAAYAEELGRGYGLDLQPDAAAGTQANPEPAEQSPEQGTEQATEEAVETVQGQVLEPQEHTKVDPPTLSPWLWLLALLITGGFLQRAWLVRAR